MKDKEIDFVATKQNDENYVQVTQEIKHEKTQKREQDQLLEINDNYPKYVVMANDFASGNYQEIKTTNIILFSKEYQIITQVRNVMCDYGFFISISSAILEVITYNGFIIRYYMRRRGCYVIQSDPFSSYTKNN